MGAVVSAGILVARSHSNDGVEIEVAHPQTSHLIRHDEDAVALCPWRNPDTDLHAFFPTATGIREETLILSRKRTEVSRELGRPGTGEENALKVYRVMRQDRILGSVVARRVRGESGVIELLLAVGVDGNVVGSRIQRLREPDDVARCLQSPAWLGAFIGKSSDAAWKVGQDIPDVPPAARPSAQAIAIAARTLLVLLSVADRSPGSAGVGQ